MHTASLMYEYLSSLIVIFSSVMVCFASFFILFYSTSFMEGLKVVIQATVSGFNMSAGLFITLIVFILFAQICTIMSMAFLAVIMANTFNSKRVIKGFIYFAVFYFVVMILTIILAVIVFAISGNLAELTATTLSQTAFITICIMGLVVYIAAAIVFYFLCQKEFNKGVNVD